MKRIILFEQTEYRFIIYFRDKKKIDWICWENGNVVSVIQTH